MKMDYKSQLKMLLFLLKNYLLQFKIVQIRILLIIIIYFVENDSPGDASRTARYLQMSWFQSSSSQLPEWRLGARQHG